MYPDGLTNVETCARLTIHAVVMFVAFLCVGTLFVACPSQTVIRDSAVYKAEVNFVDDSTAEQVENAIAVLHENCECKDGSWVTKVCEDLAETTVVMQARMPYHTEYMRYLAGITDERPSGDPPEIPASETLCTEKVTNLQVHELDDYPELDGGKNDDGGTGNM